MTNLLIISLNRQKRAIKLCLCLLMILTMSSVSAQTTSQKKVTLNMTETSLEKVFLSIQKQTGYSFVFNSDQKGLKESVTIKVSNADLKQVLDQLLTKRGYTYVFEKNIIVVSPAKKSETIVTKREATGRVTDVKGNPLIGVSVSLKNVAMGTSTDSNGEFAITIPRSLASSVFVFTYLGMKPQEVKFIGKPMQIVLREDLSEIAEVVVTGYQVVDKRMLTSSVETIKADDLDKMGALTVDEMLEGKVAGLLVTNLSSTPGAAAKIKVRSGGTFTGSRSPLWVVDGVIYEDPVPLTPEEINSFDQVNVIGNALTGVNPQDIESINVLKDASATAIYGTRAANGVIVVTTKRGKSGTSRVAYTGSVSYVNRPYYSDFNFMNSKERIDVSREIMERNLPYPREIFSYAGFEGALNDYNLGLINYEQFQQRVAQAETMNTDWFGELYRPTVTTTHSFNFSGGTDKMRYYYSLGYNYDQGNEKGVGVNRLTSRCNLDMDLSSDVLLSVGISGSIQKSNFNHTSVNAFDEAAYNSRAVSCRNEDGSLFYFDKKLSNSGGYIQSARYNILNEMGNSSRTIKNKDYNLNAQLAWDIATGIKFTSSLSYRNTTNQSEEWITDKTYMIAGLRTYDTFEDKIDDLVNSNAMVPFGGLYSAGVTDQSSFMGKVQLNFSKVIQQHAFNLNLGAEANSINYDGVNGWEAPGYNHEQGRSFIKIPRFTVDPNGYQLVDFDYTHMLNWLVGEGTRDIYPTIVDRTSNTMSMFMIFNYSFSNRYIFNFNMRSDGSNQFGQYERYKFRPAWSVSGRWNLHEESFMSKNVLEELAFRASYGFRGNPPVGTPYMVISNYQFDPDYKENLANLSSLPNSALTWEVTSTLNLGSNFSLWNGRLSGSADFSYSHSKDLLLSRPVSLVNGKGTQQYNGGQKKDYSYELSLRGVLIKQKNFGWSVSGNITHLKEEVIAGYELNGLTLSAADYLNGSIYLTGFPVDAFYSYQFAGLDNKGLPTFGGLDSDKGSVFGYFADVMKYSGQRSPTFYGGFSTEFKLYNFTMRANFSYKLGHHTRILPLYNGSQNMPMPYENMSSEFVDRWRNPGDEHTTNIPALSAEEMRINTMPNVAVKYKEVVPSGRTGWYMYDMSDERVANASHIRCQSVTLSYMLPEKALKAIRCSSMQLSLQAGNLGTLNFDKKLRGQDPEQVKSIGIPSLPTFSFSINIGI